MALTLAQILEAKQTAYADYNAAINKVLVGGQSYQIGEREFTRADLKFLQDTADKILRDIIKLQRGNTIKTGKLVTGRC
jgi:hypothetical protein